MNEQERDKIPPEQAFDGDSVDRMFRKARWKSILRNTLISAVVCIVLFLGGFILNHQLANKVGWDAYTPIELNKRITGPNLYVDHPQFHYSLLGGTLEYQEFKIIENRVIPWDDHSLKYNVFQGEATVLLGSSMGVQVKEDGQDRYYNDRSGERQMLFYHPAMRYDHYLNDLPLLNKMRDDQYIEMGLSFNKGYTLSQVEQMLPQGTHATWYWADSYNEDDLKHLKFKAEPERAEELHGFQAYSERLSDSTERTTEDQFLKDIQTVIDSSNAYYSKQATHVLAAVKSHQQSGMIIGVVVTGTKDQLKALQQLPFIKAATLGATVDMY
ncbi:hypothetical protein D3C72_1400420 [compost metagenome]